MSCQLIGYAEKNKCIVSRYCTTAAVFICPYQDRSVAAAADTSARAGQLSHQRGMCVTPYRKYPATPQPPPAVPLDCSAIKPAGGGAASFVVFVCPCCVGMLLSPI